MSAHDLDLHRMTAISDRTAFEDSGRYGGRPIPECLIVAIGGMLLTSLSLWKGIPIRVPTTQAMAFLGFHYLIPMVTLFGWGIVILLTRRSKVLIYYAAAFACYFAILIVHFNFKLWVTIANTHNWDRQLGIPMRCFGRSWTFA